MFCVEQVPLFLKRMGPPPLCSCSTIFAIFLMTPMQEGAFIRILSGPHIGSRARIAEIRPDFFIAHIVRLAPSGGKITEIKLSPAQCRPASGRGIAQ